MSLPLSLSKLSVLLFQRTDVQSETFPIVARSHRLYRSHRRGNVLYERTRFNVRDRFASSTLEVNFTKGSITEESPISEIQARIIFRTIVRLPLKSSPFFNRCAILNMAVATANLSSSSVSLSSSSLNFRAHGVMLYLCFSLSPVTPCNGPKLTMFCGK